VIDVHTIEAWVRGLLTPAPLPTTTTTFQFPALTWPL
jgi:hypothetical protein